MLDTGTLIGFFGGGGLLLAVGIFIVAMNAISLRSNDPGGVQANIQGHSTNLGRTGYWLLIGLGSLLTLGGLALVIVGSLYAAGVIHL